MEQHAGVSDSLADVVDHRSWSEVLLDSEASLRLVYRALSELGIGRHTRFYGGSWERSSVVNLQVVHGPVAIQNDVPASRVASDLPSEATERRDGAR